MTQRSRIEIVGIDVLPEIHDLSDLVWFFPRRSLILVCTTQGSHGGWKFVVVKIEVIEFSLACSISLEGSDHIHSRMAGDVLLLELEIFCHFLSLPQVARLVELVFVSEAVDNLNGYFFLLLFRLWLF